MENCLTIFSFKRKTDDARKRAVSSISDKRNPTSAQLIKKQFFKTHNIFFVCFKINNIFLQRGCHAND